MHSLYIRCPKCTWEPDETCVWMCSVCKTKWNTFDTGAECPTCGEIYENTQCLRSRGGCDRMSLHEEWHVDFIEPKPPASSQSFWKKKEQYLIISEDKIWVELSLSWLAGKFEHLNFWSIATILPRDIYAKYDFKNKEDDASFLLKEIGKIINIDTSEISIVFLAVESEGTPEDELTVMALAATGQDESKYNFEPIPNVFWVKVDN